MIFAFIIILLGRYLITPIIFNPKLDFDKTYRYLDDKNCVFVDYRGINKTESNKFIKDNTDYFDLLAFKSRFRVIAKVKNENKLKIFWIEIKTWRSLFIEAKTVYIEETNIDLIREIEANYFQKTISIFDNCPACNSKIKQTDNICPDCGLHLE